MRRSRGRGGSGGHNGGHSGGGHSGGGHNNNNGRRPSTPSRHQVFDSNGPDIRIRGTAWQVYEKYLSMARDAQGSGDRVQAENYLQHAEHYYRIILAIAEATGESFQQQRPQQQTEGNEGQPQQQDQPVTDEQPSDEGLAAVPQAAIA